MQTFVKTPISNIGTRCRHPDALPRHPQCPCQLRASLQLGSSPETAQWVPCRGAARGAPRQKGLDLTTSATRDGGWPRTAGVGVSPALASKRTHQDVTYAPEPLQGQAEAGLHLRSILASASRPPPAPVHLQQRKLSVPLPCLETAIGGSLHPENKFPGPHVVFEALPSQPWLGPSAQLLPGCPVLKKTPQIPAALSWLCRAWPGPPFSALYLGDPLSFRASLMGTSTRKPAWAAGLGPTH